MATLPTKAHSCVTKKNGIYERFNHEKIIKSCLMVDVPMWAAEKIASQVAAAAYDNISTKEIKMLVYDSLKVIDEKLAERYLAANTLRVRTSRDTIESFDQTKIEKTLVVETGASEELARNIATDVHKELKRLHLEYLTAPIIREIVNTKLVEYGLETLRRRYTRLGIPVYNITNLIQNGSRDYANMIHNP
jgi:2-phosphoglycerate kinase